MVSGWLMADLNCLGNVRSRSECLLNANMKYEMGYKHMV